jgi:hypothetical protein
MKLGVKIPNIIFDRKISVVVGALAIFLVSIDLLMSRQILP